MARTLKEEEHIQKRLEILHIAQRLVLTKGYEYMAIQDVLNELNISKGAFYHYFDPKHTLLEAMIDRMQQEALNKIAPILEDPRLTALEKLHRYFSEGAAWKVQHKEMMLQMLHVWHADENALVRQKILKGGIQIIAPALTGIVRQGNQEGVFHAPHINHAAEFMIILFKGWEKHLPMYC